MGRRWSTIALVVAGAAVMLAGPACGGDGEDREGTQPAPDVTTFEQGRFDELPVFPRSDPFGPRSEKDGVVARSYRATSADPGQIIDFYARELAGRGWRMAEPVFRSDAESRGDWVLDDYRLEVSATRVDDDRNPTSADAVAQYSLVLRPR